MPEKKPLSGGNSFPAKRRVSDPIVFSREDWLDDASCIKEIPWRDFKETFFPEYGPHIPPITKEVCHACPVRRDCLRQAYLVAYGNAESLEVHSGYYGGFSARQRKLNSLDDLLEIIDEEEASTN